jgi:pimeloyl-[acyl-carrier protein] synthase
LKYREKSMLNLDPPDHTRMRALVNKAFTPAMVNEMRRHIENITNNLLDKVQPKGEMDLIAEFAFVIPVTVIAEMLGVPAEDRERFKGWSHALTELLEPSLDVTKAMKAVAANNELINYLRPLVAERKKNPQKDLISALGAAELDGNKLTDYELLANVILILVAGHETTVNLIGNSVISLMRNPDQLDLLKSDPNLMESAVEEFLRYDSPVQFVRRNADSGLELAGKEIRQNDLLVMMLGAANRDPAQFENPDKLDITRTNNKHLAFGSGIHHCLGAALARTEGQIALSTLLRRVPGLKLKTTNLEYKTPFSLRGVKAMPVTF